MRIELTVTECKWLAALVKRDKLDNIQYNKEMPSRAFELRRDNMADLENKLNTAIEKQIQKDRRDSR
jgi:hypothetical protein